MPARVQLMALAAGLVMASAGAQAGTIVLTVNNPTDPQTYSSISAAVAAANADLNLDNYYDIKVATGTYTNDFANVLRPMTIEAAGGPVRLLATVPPLFNKGIIVTTSSLTVRGLTFEGAAIDDSLGGNGAGIRDQSAGATTLRVENSTFLNNQDAILTAGSNYQETVQIINSTFLNNGSGTGQTHALYVGDALSLLVENSVFCGTLEGHNIKSRAMNTTVRGSQLYDGATGVGCNSAGTTSYAIESTNGGKVIINDVDIFQGSGTHNTTMVRFGADGLFPGPTINSLLVSNTNFTSGNFGIGIQAPANATGCTLSNTTFTGVTTPVSPPSFCTTSTQPDVSPDGSTISGGTGTLVTAHGTWTFGAPASPGNWLILLNGTVASGGVGSELEVANGGQMYGVGQDSRWYVWQSGAWALTTDLPPPPPPSDVSPDGSTISGGTGTLVTAHGTWTFGAPASPGNWLILLGGVQASGGVASELEVANGGQMYAFGQDSRWYVWQSGVWTLTTYSP